MDSVRFMLDLYDNIDLFMLVLARVLGFMLMLPIIGGNNLPMQLRLGFAFFLSMIIYINGSVAIGVYDESIFNFVIMLLTELMTGLILSFVIYCIFTVAFFVGQIVDFQIGFSMVSVMNPQTQQQVPITGNVFYFLLTTILITSGGLHILIFIIAKTFTIIPLAKAYIASNSDLMRVLIDIVVRYLAVGLQISLPVLGTILVLDVALGLLTKASPQMNVFIVGIPLKLFCGLFILWLIMPMFLDVYKIFIDHIAIYTEDVLKGMMPR